MRTLNEITNSQESRYNKSKIILDENDVVDIGFFTLLYPLFYNRELAVATPTDWIEKSQINNCSICIETKELKICQ